MVQAMDGYAGIDWTQYFQDRPFWNTATNCNHTGNNPNQEQACQMITGQWPDYGQGSMKTYEQLPNVERIAWY